MFLELNVNEYKYIYEPSLALMQRCFHQMNLFNIYVKELHITKEVCNFKISDTNIIKDKLLMLLFRDKLYSFMESTG